MSRPNDRLPYRQHAAGSVSPERRPRWWPAVVTIAVLGLALAFVWSNPEDAEEQREKRAAERSRANDRKSYMTSELTLGKAKAAIRANWQWEKDKIVIRLAPTLAAPSHYVQISARGESDSQEAPPEFPLPGAAQITLPIGDPPVAITVRVALGDENWKKGDTAPSRLLRLSPEGTLTDASTGEVLPSESS